MSSTSIQHRRQSPSPNQNLDVPPLASPFEIVTQAEPSTSLTRPVFPPRRPYRHQRKQAQHITARHLSMGMLVNSPTLQSPCSCPKTPPNKFPISTSSPPPMLRRGAHSPASSVYFDHALESIADPISDRGVSEERQIATSITSLLDLAFRRSADRIQAELMNLRNFCVKVMTSKLSREKEDEPYPSIPSSLDSQDRIMMDWIDDFVHDELIQDSPLPESHELISPSTTYYSLSPSTSPLILDSLDLPLRPIDDMLVPRSSYPSPSSLSRTSSSSSLYPSAPIIVHPCRTSHDEATVESTSNFVNQSELRGRKRKRAFSSVEQSSPIPKCRRLRRSASPLSLSEENEVEAELLELEWCPLPQRTRNNVQSPSLQPISLSNKRHVMWSSDPPFAYDANPTNAHPPSRIIDKIFLLNGD